MEKSTLKEWLDRAVEKIYPSREEFEKALKKEKLKIYIGMDATAPRLHLGHSTNFLILKKLQELGHKIIILVGDFTGMIGDPTDKLATRKPLTKREVLENSKTYMQQVKKILSFSGKNPAVMKFNSKWQEKMTFGNIVNLAANLSIQQLLERDMFQERLKNNKTISLHEFLYPLVQGYDSVAMDVDAEMGGTDQTFNMLCGRILMRKLKNKEKFVITTKLLENPKTHQKLMSKSEGDYIALDDPAKEMFGKIMALPDEAILSCFTFCTDSSNSEINKIKKELAETDNPKNLKIRLAKEIVKLYHSEEEANNAEADFNRVFVNQETPFDIPEYKVKKSVCESLAALLVDVKFAPSKSEARRLISQGAVKIDNAKIIEDKENLCLHDNMIIKVGKRRFIKIKFETRSTKSETISKSK